jgi:hypothetical protein
MSTVIGRTYSLDFTQASYEDVTEEISARAKLRKEIVVRMHDRFEVIQSHFTEFPPDVKAAISGISWDIADLEHEAYHNARAEMYRWMVNDCGRLLRYIVLRLFRSLGLPESKEQIDWAIDWASFQLLYGEVCKGNSKVMIAKEFGQDKAYWTRVSKGRVVESLRRFATWVRGMIKKDVEGEETEESWSYDQVVDGLTHESLKEITEASMRIQRMAERREDWAVACKIAYAEGIDKALIFLKSGDFSDREIEKFRKEIRKPE